jgi:hypothetical protein
MTRIHSYKVAIFDDKFNQLNNLFYSSEASPFEPFLIKIENRVLNYLTFKNEKSLLTTV